MGTVCPYCNLEVNESEIELEDGCCPECGSVITVSMSYDDDDGPTVFEENDDFPIDMSYDDINDDD